MRSLCWLLPLLALCSCKDNQQEPKAPQKPSETLSETTAQPYTESYSKAELVSNLTALIDPEKLDTLKGKRAATPRLRKACYWLQMAHTAGLDVGQIIDLSYDPDGPYGRLSYDQSGPYGFHRAKAQRDSLIRNRLILERLGCFDEAGLAKLRKGNAPTITKGPYAGEIVTGDHIIPRSVCPELDNKIYNLEMMPLTLNQRKGAKVTQRQIDLAKRWNADGLLSDAGFKAVLAGR